jgi:hypothetical protein
MGDAADSSTAWQATHALQRNLQLTKITVQLISAKIMTKQNQASVNVLWHTITDVDEIPRPESVYCVQDSQRFFSCF